MPLSLYHPVERSNMSHESKSTIRKWFDKVTGLSHTSGTMKGHAKEAALTVRQFGEGMVTGAVLGAINAELKGGLDPHGIPVDAGVAAAGAIGAFAFANEEYAHDLRNIGTAGATVFAFRKTDALLSQKKAAKIAGEMGDDMGEDIGAEDPIVAASRAL